MQISKLFFSVVFATVAFLSLLTLTTPNQAFGDSESILWSFGNGNDGSDPGAGLIMDTSGNLYSTTYAGGVYGGGTVFELTPSGVESTLWSFGNATDGSGPYGGLIMDSTGNLYGTTVVGGATANEDGTVFELTPPLTTGGKWIESVLFSFGNNIAGEGGGPNAGVIMDARGNLYGTAAQGAYGSPTSCGGVVFQLTPPSTSEGNWTESILWNFGKGKDGMCPNAGVIMDTRGYL